MLKNPKPFLEKAQKENKALAHFNINNLEMVKAVSEGAESQNQPIFIAVTETAIEYAGLDYLVNLVKTASEQVKVDTFLHLDHGKSLKTVERAVEKGFTSIMFDGSALPLTENIAQTREARKIIGDRDICLEAELGHVGRQDDQTEILTDPQTVVEFISQTTIDSLAVAVGTVHGPVKNMDLDYQRLKEIDQSTSVPLVIHGGSGLKPEQIEKLKKNGANKINIDSEIRLAFMRGIKQQIAEIDPRRGLRAAMNEMRTVVEEKIRIISR